MSNEELDACEIMFERFIEFCIDNGIIEQDGEIYDRLEDYLKWVKEKQRQLKLEF